MERGSKPAHRLARARDAERLDQYATAAPDRVAADLDALASAKDRLVQQAAAVDELLREARRLAAPMRDGHGPIARTMRAAFHERAGEAQGVVRALTDYRDELTKVLSAIQQTMESYGRGELSARQQRLGRRLVEVNKTVQDELNALTAETRAAAGPPF